MLTSHLSSAQRVIEWNRARYDQAYSAPLALRLLLEEVDELFAAPSKVEVLDAVGDIAFVAIGVYWKLGFSPQEVCDFIHSQDLRAMSSEAALSWVYTIEEMAMNNAIVSNKPGTFPGLMMASFSLFVVALGTLRGLGMQDAFYDVLKAICDSNDTKEVKGKTAPNVKANISKGANFVPPTVALIEILRVYQDAQQIQAILNEAVN